MDKFWDDVQALVGKGLVNRAHSAHLALRIKDVAAFKTWLLEDLTSDKRRLALTPDVTGAFEDKLHARGLYQIAFSPTGLEEMGAGPEVMKGFPDPFLSGMAPMPESGAETTRRAGILGDVGPNNERYWDWGGARCEGVKGRDIHVFLMLFSPFEGAVKFWVGKALEPRSGLALACGGKDPKTAKTAIFTRLERKKEDPTHPIEHFGYLDGVSQPMIKGLGRAEHARLNRPETHRLHAVAAGEFVLGQKNERDVETPFPKQNCFGENGSYLVVRQLEQHVGAFNGMVRELAAQMGDPNDIDTLENAAAKIMGRRRDGGPLTDQPRENGSFSSFGFAERDASGLHCPMSSHIRRANPRDSREDDPEIALRLSKRHRILRRGRIYGENAKNENFDAEDREGQGVLFMCVNADIEQQFEFIQQTWLNNPTFAGCEGEVDPIVAGREPTETRFTAPARPISTVVERGQALVTMRGGGYFFLPGRAALGWLAKQKPRSPSAVAAG